MFQFLPKKIQYAIKNTNCNLLYELRIRAEKPIKINYNGEYLYLSQRGATNLRDNALTLSKNEIEDIVFSASGYSVYSYSEQMKECFITTSKGVRIGLAGTIVRENEKIIAVRDVLSLCVRIPHAVKNCADKIYELCEKDELRNCIVLSPPGLGKTTILRELARNIAEKYPCKNLLIVDERGEISSFNTFDADVLKFSKKEDAFHFGIRALRPDVIVTDELQREDYNSVQRAIEAGLVVIASSHFGLKIEDFPYKFFERYVLLDKNIIGQAIGIYNELFENILI